jgi:hypothetical protein
MSTVTWAGPPAGTIAGTSETYIHSALGIAAESSWTFEVRSVFAEDQPPRTGEGAHRAAGATRARLARELEVLAIARDLLHGLEGDPDGGLAVHGHIDRERSGRDGQPGRTKSDREAPPAVGTAKTSTQGAPRSTTSMFPRFRGVAWKSALKFPG